MVHILERRKTVRGKEENSLGDSQEKYRTILESIEEGYYEVDLAGNYTFFNDSLCRILGSSREETVGINYRKYVNKENAKKLFKGFNEVYRTGVPTKIVDYEITRKDRTKRYMETSVSLRRDSSGKAIGFKGVVRDVTEHKKTKEALEKSEEKYRTLLDNASDAILLANDEGNLLELNKKAEELLGYTRQELWGVNIANIHPPEEMEKIMNGFKEINQNGLGAVNDTAVLRKDGKTVFVDISGSVIEYSGKKVLQGIFRDITERKQAEEALTNSEAKLRKEQKFSRLLLDTSPALIVAIGYDRKTLMMNKALLDTLEYTEEEIKGTDYLTTFVPKEDRGMLSDVFRKIIQEGIATVNENQIISKSGRTYLIEWHGRTVSDEVEGSGFFVGVGIDITERKRAEDALKKNREELIKKNQEIEESRKNVQLTLEKLAAAYEELKTSQTKILQQEKMASIGQLAAGVAHEINNPMAFIASNLGTLDKYIRRLKDFIQAQSEAIKSLKATEAIAKLEKKRKELKLDYTIDDIDLLVKESRDGSERVQKIIQGLNRFSRMDNAEYKDANINECIESSINIVGNELQQKATLHKDYGNLPPTKCYPQKLSQVFINLLINAIQAIETKGKIKIKTWEKDGSIWVTISDKGCGIPRENQSKIFEPFFTTKEVGKGTGLGLSIAYEIMQRHKGEISFESKEGKGTTFTIRMPIV